MSKFIKRASWWKFWSPAESGLTGGLLFGLALSLATFSGSLMVALILRLVRTP